MRPRRVFVFRDVHAISQPEVMIAKATEHLDEQGNLNEAFSKQHIQQLLKALVAWTRRWTSSAPPSAGG